MKFLPRSRHTPQPAPSANGAAASELIQRGLQAEILTKWENGLLVFDPGPSGAVNTEGVMRLKDDLA
jgi:hypothetical protein